MDNTQSLLFYIAIDYALHKAYLPMKMRCEFLFAFTSDVPFTFDLKSTRMRNAGTDYLDFKAALKEYAVSLHDLLDSMAVRQNYIAKLDFYFSEENLLYLLGQNLSDDHKYKLYEYIIEIALYDGKFQAWKINIVNAFEKGLSIDRERAEWFRKEHLRKKGFFKFEKVQYSTGQKLMAMLISAKSLLISDDIIDVEERLRLEELISDLEIALPKNSEWARFFKMSTSNYNKRFAHEIELRDKRLITAIVHRIIVGDGVVDPKEKKFFGEVFDKFGMRKSDLTFLRELKSHTMHDLLASLSGQELFYALNLCLEMTLSDGEMHVAEEALLDEIITFLQEAELDDSLLESAYIQYLEFILKNPTLTRRYGSFLTKYEMVFHKLSKTDFDTEYYLVVLFIMLNTHFKETVNLPEILKVIRSLNLMNEQFDKINYKMTKIYNDQMEVESLYYAFLSLQMIVEDNLNDNFHVQIKKLYELICFNLDKKFKSDLMVYYMLKMLVADDRVDALEDEFFNKVIQHFEMGDEAIRRYIFVASFEAGKEITISDVFNYDKY